MVTVPLPGRVVNSLHGFSIVFGVDVDACVTANEMPASHLEPKNMKHAKSCHPGPRLMDDDFLGLVLYLP